MPRLSAPLALLALRQSGYIVTAATLRSWVHRGHITRTASGYSLEEITTYLDRRDTPRDHPDIAAGRDMCNAV
ncbi:hypothetical protein LY15_001111 [Prauserella flava]|nr:hypothetical protein [Prauserella flava]MCR3735837.1 hypothetical protein [Prauserella salsuginis]